MALTINHQTNDISATSGSMTIDGSAVGGGGALTTAAISGSSQTVDFSAADIFVSTADEDVTYTFSNPSSVDKVDLIVDFAALGGFTAEYMNYTGNKISVVSQATAPQGLFFKPDGTKMYVICSSQDAIFQYSLSPSWDITSAVYDNISFSVSSQTTSPTGIFFKPDGTKMYISGIVNDEVNEFSLSTAWSISTASFTRTFSVAAKATSPDDLFFKSDGTKMYIVDSNEDKVFQYELSTAWNISTSSFEEESPSLTALEGLLTSLAFSADGTKMFVLGRASDQVSQLELSTAWDVSTATEAGINFSVINEASNASGITFKSDGQKFYLVDYGFDSVFEYNSLGGPTLSFPSSFEKPTFNVQPNKKSVLSIVTTDGGVSYQAISQSGPIG